jgi:predicted transcriptional regulator
MKYRAALTSRQVRHYLPLLVSNEKLKFDARSRKYKITAKGSRLLAMEKIFQETRSPDKDK